MNLAPSFSLLSTSYKPRPVKAARLHSLGEGADALVEVQLGIRRKDRMRSKRFQRLLGKVSHIRLSGAGDGGWNKERVVLWPLIG